LFFDGSACREGQGVGLVLISPIGAVFETSAHLENFCTNNQAEYEALLLGLQILNAMDVKHVEAFGDYLLIVQQVAGNFQCFDGILNSYLDKCLEIIATFDDFTINHVARCDNSMANDLAQQASGFRFSRGKTYFQEPMFDNVIRCIEGSTTEYEILAPNVPSSVTDIIVATEVDDWRTPFIRYL